ncbi:glycine--tRNA ligase subunit beta [uncultured Nevskia sp.]|uniref:glycine--tRNA ligase subunit beta n=2 Tax=Nevskia TaxID=64001 RepID=UPI0025CD5737|nr:glycine--tRNA ligase subunit beta [uncultured Nevskia sp.]
MSSTAPLLIEIGCEDLPARYVVPLAEALSAGVTNGLSKRGVATGTARTFATPRRIAVQIDAVAVQQPDQAVERSGPAVAAATKDGVPTPAALGFAKTCGVEFAELGEKNGKLHFSKLQPGKATASLLPEIFEETLKSMDELVPKRMRWGSGEETFVRPVQWLTALLGTDIIPLRRFGLESGRLSYGHRFHAPAAITLADPSVYVESLRNARVWAEVATRKTEIERQIKTEAAKLGGIARIDASLLDEVTALVEWPVVISGRIEERFLELPPEVIVATVETNQRYFTVFDGAGKLLPSFITISNIESKDVAQVIQGNERVVRPRLSDALFFWQQDLKLPFSDEAAYTEKLASATFQKDLGTVADKLKRIHTLATFVVAEKLAEKAAINAEQVEGASRAAKRCKFDLVTKMVYEFPELQGVMGGYYALKAGESQAVADAIREHYLPTQAGTSIPSAVEGQIVALADKLDTLAGIFAIGQKPTASKDPYALRRAALGILRILVEGKLPLDLRDLLSGALQELPAGKRDEATLKELLTFVQERHRAWRVGSEFDGRPVTVEMFEAVAALGITQPLDFEARLRAIHSFWALPEAASLAAAHKRVRNVLKQAGDGGSDVDAAKFESAAESELYAALNAVNAAPASDYAERLKQLASLKAPVDAFFTGVMVMADDPAVRANRLALLRQLDRVCREVADISCLPG